MEYTNKYNLPQEIVNAIMKDRYTDLSEEPSDYSATTLISPIQQTILKRRYPKDHIVRDVIDSYWAFIGSIAHTVLEEAWHESIGSVVEKRLYVDVLGKSISGKMDCYHNGEIRDYKSTKAYKLIKGDYSDWEKQLNIYAYLCRKNGYSVNRLRVFAFILDWKEGEIVRQKGYPECPIIEIPLRLWSEEAQEAYIKGRVQELQYADLVHDQKLAECFPCSNRDMWQDVKDYCVKKKDSDRATKVFDTMEEAEEYYKSKDKNIFECITRYTPKTRCLKYCPISHICKQNNPTEAPVAIDTIF